MKGLRRARRLFLAAAGLGALALSALPAPARAQADPFDILFGDEPETLDAGEHGAAGHDDFTIVGLRLRDLPLAADIPAWETRAGLCVAPAPVFGALEFPIREDAPGVFAGWFITPEREIALDLNTRRARVAGQEIPLGESDVQDTPDGRCLTLSALSRLLPLSAEYAPASLRVVLIPAETLPLEARLEREARRAELRRPADTDNADFTDIANPRRALSWPTGDVSIDLVAGPSGMDAQAGIEASLDLAWTTARVRTVTTPDAMAESVRLTLSRESLDARELGPLRARSLDVGDVAAPPQPLISRALPGVGLVVSSRPVVKPDLFDRIELRGPLPVGWEAELYRDEALIDWVTEPDGQGDYVFAEVTLVSGYNRYRVELYGPNGERDTRDFVRFVGSELQPENEAYYTLALVKGGGGLFDPLLSDAGDVDEQETALRATVETALSPVMTARLDAAVPVADARGARPQAAVSLAGSALAGYGVVRLASDGRGLPAVEAAFARRLSERSSLSLTATDFGALESAVNGSGPGRLQRAASVSLDTALVSGTRVRPLRLDLGFDQSASGLTRTAVSARISDTLAGVRLTHSGTLARLSGGTEASLGYDGQWLAARAIGGWRVRGALDYGWRGEDGLRLRALSLSASGRLGPQDQFQTTLSRDVQTGKTAIEANWSRRFRRFTLSAGGMADAGGAWRAALSLSFSLARDPDTRSYSMGEPGLSRSGGLRPFVFEDRDADGVFSAGDQPLEGAKFMLDHALRSATTGPDGRLTLTGIEPLRPVDLELQASSLPDPLMRPAVSGQTVAVRPGQIVALAIPVVMTGEVEASVALVRGEYRVPVAGVEIEVVDEDGRVVARGRSEYDGYVYLEGVPMGRHSLRVAGGRDSSQPGFTLSRDDPSALGLSVLVFG